MSANKEPLPFRDYPAIQDHFGRDEVEHMTGYFHFIAPGRAGPRRYYTQVNSAI